MSYNESLKSDSNYPPMSQSDWNSAPWNQSDPDPKEFDITISQTLSKNTSVITSDYTIESNYLDADEGGGYVDEIITNETDWNKAYNEEHCTPLELIQEFERFLIKNLQKGYYDNDKEKKQINWLLDECSNWVEDETEIVEE